MSHLRYLGYILLHRWYVFIECIKLGVPLLGALHDLSKFLPDEWFPYHQWFYTDEKSKEWFRIYPKYGVVELAPFGEFCENRFNIAWLKHIHRNKHHWQHWVLHFDDGGQTYIPMPDRYRREMLADWIGAGKAIYGKQADTVCWYWEHREIILLHPETRRWIEGRLGLKERP